MSSLSLDWINAVKKSGRFSGVEWDRQMLVDVTTLDALVSRHGTPNFIKLDVEGFESEALSGLSDLRGATVSFEFVPERWEELEACVSRLREIGAREFNYSIGETMCFRLKSWVNAVDLMRELHWLQGDTRVFGDVLAR